MTDEDIEILKADIELNADRWFTEHVTKKNLRWPIAEHQAKRIAIAAYVRGYVSNIEHLTEGDDA